MHLIPNSDGQPEPLTEVTRGGKHVEIHSEKWHRCVNKVKAKGGVESPYAICTSSIGYAGSFTKGHRKGARTPGGRKKRMK